MVERVFSMRLLRKYPCQTWRGLAIIHFLKAETGLFLHEFEPGQFGKLLVFLGLMLAAVGTLVMGLSRLGLFRLPGDIEFGGKNWRIFVPVVSCIVLSLVLTLILWLVHFFYRK